MVVGSRYGGVPGERFGTLWRGPVVSSDCLLMASSTSVPTPEKPKLRGILHMVAAPAAIPAAWLLASHARDGLEASAAVFGISLVAMLSTSASYHVPKWSPERRAMLQRIDHAMIFVLIGGTYVPFLAALDDHIPHAYRWIILAGTLAGVIRSLVVRAKTKLGRVVSYGALIVASVLVMPRIQAVLGTSIMAMLLGGCLVYGVGAVAYARKRPNPLPGVFGHHELFHLAVILGAACHFVAAWWAVGAV